MSPKPESDQTIRLLVPRSWSCVTRVNERVKVVHIFVLYLFLSVVLKQSSRLDHNFPFILLFTNLAFGNERQIKLQEVLEPDLVVCEASTLLGMLLKVN